MENKMKDSEIIEELCEALHLSANLLSEKIEYSNSSSIYHILNGTNKLSRGFIERVLGKFPNVSEDFLRTGKKPILIDNSIAMAQKNLRFKNAVSFDEVPGILKNIENLLSEINEKMDN